MNEVITIPPFVEKNKLPGLDGLRGISILLVIISHVFFNTGFEKTSSIGIIGVQIFFVISGFLITTLLLKEKATYKAINLKYFFIRRALRILPVFLLFIAVVFILNIVFHLGISKWNFLSSILFLKNIPIAGEQWYTGHLWSLCVEEQFYLIFPFIISKLKINQYKIFLFCMLITVPVVHFLFFRNVGMFYTNKIVHLISMFIVNVFSVGTLLIMTGSLLAVLLFENVSYVVKLKSARRYTSVFILIVAVIIRMEYSRFYLPCFSEELFGLLVAVMIVINLNVKSALSKLLNKKWIATIGVFSYSIYLWQQLFTYNQPWKNSFAYGDSIVLNLFALAIVSYISYEFYEKKFLVLKNRFSKVPK